MFQLTSYARPWDTRRISNVEGKTIYAFYLVLANGNLHPLKPIFEMASSIFSAKSV